MSPYVLASVTTDEGGSAGVLPLLILVLLFVVTIALIRNMSARLRRLPKSFDEQPPKPPAEP